MQKRDKIIKGRYRECRMAVGLTQNKAAEALSITPSKLCHIEKFSYEPSLSLLIRMGILYKVTLEFLLGFVNLAKERDPDFYTNNRFEGTKKLLLSFYREIERNDGKISYLPANSLYTNHLINVKYPRYPLNRIKKQKDDIK